MDEKSSFGIAASKETIIALQENYGITEQVAAHVRRYGDICLPRIDTYLEYFYRWVAKQPDWILLEDPALLAHVKSRQVEYWQNFFEANIDVDYLISRQVVGMAHARVGLSLTTYMSGVNRSLGIFSSDLYDGSLAPAERVQILQSLTRFVNMDTAIVVDTYVRMTNRTMSEQSRALAEMSTPVTALWQGILMLPIVGILDSRRAGDIVKSVLDELVKSRSKIIILDISGVAVVDTAVAHHLLKITKATRLMGCRCVISGISPAVAETIVELGITVDDVVTVTNLQDALLQAFQLTGVTTRLGVLPTT